MNLSVDHWRLWLGPHLAVSFQRTTRLPEPSPRPPTSYGALPIWMTDDAARRDLDADALVPGDAEEAFWIGVEPVDDRIASALRVGVEMARARDLVDAVTGREWSSTLTESPQNYIVSPPQLSLFGISNGAGRARQFVGVGRTGDDGDGIARMRLVYAPPRRVPALPPRARPSSLLHTEHGSASRANHLQTDVADNAFVDQIIAPDPYGIEHWDFVGSSPMIVGFVSHDAFTRLSGLPRLGPMDPSTIYGGWRLP